MNSWAQKLVKLFKFYLVDHTAFLQDLKFKIGWWCHHRWQWPTSPGLQQGPSTLRVCLFNHGFRRLCWQFFRTGFWFFYLLHNPRDGVVFSAGQPRSTCPKQLINFRSIHQMITWFMTWTRSIGQLICIWLIKISKI